ncbi:hypothetical protein [Dactylosporangium sp. CA-139066]|uniref:hypothetical protein n=1 Tax=Dactylosporangium sp. CA-139066 TaxID=3239930 RepID=UPI003D8FC20E
MNTHLCDCLAGVWGTFFERGLVDRLLDAATAARDTAEAVTAAESAVCRSDRQAQQAGLALGRGGRTALAWSAARQRRASGRAHLADLAGQWGVHALHLARVAATALRIVVADPAAPVTSRQVGFGSLVAVAALVDDPGLLPAPPGAVLHADPSDAATPPSLLVSYQHVLDAIGGGPARLPGHRGCAAPCLEASQPGAPLRLAAAVHAYGFEALRQVALVTSTLEEVRHCAAYRPAQGPDLR